MQPTPNFTGTWTLQSPARAVANIGGVTGGGTEMTIVHNASTIRFTRTYGTGLASLLVRLDGSESKHAVPSFIDEGFTSALTSVARWDGDKLVIQTVRVASGSPAGKPARTETLEMLSLSGGRLTVERASRPAGDATPVRLTKEQYKKKS